jgi:5-methyltetrahydrofolate--homocysteine methyltransferase
MFDANSLGRSTPLLLDGAWGTELQAHGLALGACPDLWNLTQPQRVEAVAGSYVEAGSEVILTNTFGANRIALARHDLAQRVSEINRAGAAISLRAAEGRAQVVAAVGPTGKRLALQDVSETELQQVFAEQLLALKEGGIEAVVFETFTDLDELCVALTAAKSFGLFAVSCMVFDLGETRDRPALGATPERAVERLTAGGSDAIGANCGFGIDTFVTTCRRLRALTALPLWFKPNAGLPELVDGRATYAATPQEFAAGAIALVEAGANLVGGCCGTNPAFIAAIAQAFAACRLDRGQPGGTFTQSQ